MNTQFKKGVLEICVLSLVFEKDMYGYEVVNRISELIDVNEGTIYPILRRLTKEGYFETYMRESNEGPARKYYRITVLGINNLEKLKKEWKEFVSAVEEFIK